MPANRASRETFYSVDAAWLHMDAPANMVMITGLCIFDEPVDYERLKQTVETRLLRFPRFRQRVKESRLPFSLPTWEPDPCFDLDTHLRRTALPAPGDWATLMELVEELMRIPLHPEKPLWQMHLVEGYGPGSALIVRLSHALADGVALMEVTRYITDLSPDAPPPAERGPEVEEESSPLVQALVQALDTIDDTLRFSKKLVRESISTVRSPRRLLRTAAITTSGALALGKLLFIPPDRRTILKGRCGPAKRAAASDPVPLTSVKTVGNVLGATVNDVVLSAVSGGFRRYLEACGQPVDGLEIRAIVPVYLRSGSDPKMGNGFGLTFLSLPVGIQDPVKRLEVLKERMDAIKSTPEAPVAYAILYGMGPTPVPITRLIAAVFGAKGTAVMTNVVGPKEVNYMAGKAIRRLMFWVPQPAGLAVGLSIISYAGEITVGLATDASVVPDPGRIMAGFHAEFEELQRRAAEKNGLDTKDDQRSPALRSSTLR
jgi:WS/DGAT/MGAT family acyltransferase